MHSRRAAIAALGAVPLGLLMTAIDAPLRAANGYEITMLSKDPSDPSRAMHFSPDLLKIPAGSQVTFVPGAPGHNTQSTPGMLPEDATPWRFGFGKGGSVTLNVPGFYGYHCLPHRGLGMVGLIIVDGPGMTANLASAKAVKQVGKAADQWRALWARAEALL